MRESDGAVKIALRSAAIPLRVVLFPADAIYKTLSKTREHIKTKQPLQRAWEIPLQVMREDYLLLLGFLWLVQSKTGEIVQSYSFDSASGDFDNADDGDLLVVVETLANNELGYGWAESFMNTKYQHFKRKVYIHATSYKDMVEQLQSIANNHGPISRLDIVGFGAEGEFSIGRDSVDAFTINVNPKLSGVFQENAQIRFSTCLSGHGEEGDKLLQSVGQAMLEKGGTIYASTVSYYPLDEGVFKLGLGNHARAVARLFTLGPAAAYERISARFDFSSIGLPHRGSLMGFHSKEPKVKVWKVAPSVP